MLFSLLGGGGIWNADVVPGSRSKALPWLWLAVLAVAALYGAGRLRALLGSRVFIALVALALAGLFIAWLPALPGGAALVRSLVAHVPGAGLIRDAQKWILPLVLLEALLVGAAVDRLTGRVRTAHWAVVLAIAAALTPLLALPDAAASVRPTLTPVHYPRDWQVVAARVRGPGDVAVLPWGSYRRFDWVGVDSVLDPAPRWLPAATVVDDRLAVGGRVLRGESPRSARAGAALTSGPALATRLGDDGIGWIVVEHGTPGTLPDLAGLSSVYRGRDLSLYRVPGRVTAGRIGAGRVVAVVVGDMVALLTLLSCAVVLPIASRTRRKARRVAEPPLL